MRSPQMTQQEYERKIDAVLKCGANRGPHDYTPIVWKKIKNDDGSEIEWVQVFMCRVCLVRVERETLSNNFNVITV